MSQGRYIQKNDKIKCNDANCEKIHGQDAEMRTATNVLAVGYCNGVNVLAELESIQI